MKKKKGGSVPRGDACGHHLLADFYGCQPGILTDSTTLEKAMIAAAEESGATVLECRLHHFPGGGVTGVLTLKESHISIHTWPERSYAAIDIFLCGDLSARRALRALADKLGPARSEIFDHARGSKVENAEISAAAHDASIDSAGRSRMGVLYGLTLIVAACSIVYELLLAQTLSALLGNTVLRYSITIGCYLGALGIGAMLCSHAPPNAERRLMSTELALSLLGGIAVPLFYFLDMAQRYFYYQSDGFMQGTLWAPTGFLIATHLVILLIGLLSGFEVPLLLAMGRERRSASTNTLLGIDYLGALFGSVLFPLVLLRSFGLLATGFMVATLNAVAAILILALKPGRRSMPLAAAGTALAVCLLAALARSGDIEQYFLRKFYYVFSMDSWAEMVHARPDLPEVERYRSPYQQIDIVQMPSGQQWVYSMVSSKDEKRPMYPQGMRLYIDRDFQVYSGADELYHEWFVHVPIQSIGRVPRSVLVLGGGDGLAVRELLLYDDVMRVVHVELDPRMLDLVEHHPTLVRMNEHPHDDPRVEVVRGDAFHWLRSTREKFDAILIDMPYPRNYNLAQVYSREFYSLARAHLSDEGFLMLDAPDGDCDVSDGLYPVYYNTLRAAGFARVMPVISRFDLEAEPIAQQLDELAYGMEMYAQTAEGTVELNPVQRRQFIKSTMEDVLYSAEQEFLLAYPRDREPLETWTDFGIPLMALRPEHLPLAFVDHCSRDRDPMLVNSIFRPTLPELELLSVQRP